MSDVTDKSTVSLADVIKAGNGLIAVYSYYFVRVGARVLHLVLHTYLVPMKNYILGEEVICPPPPPL